MDNPWPIIDDIISTDDVLPYLDETSESLKQNYGGKLQSKTSKIKYVLKGMHQTMSMLSDFSSLVGKSMDEASSEEVKDIENGRKAAVVVNHNYKYEIYNDHLYYKLFTINIPEFYPITIKAAAGTVDEGEKEISINNIEELKRVFSDIVASDKVRLIIKKMLL